MSVLNLVGTVLGEEHIEIVSNVAEGLAGFEGKFFESAAAFSGGEFEEFLVELVALAGDDRKECGEGNAGVPCSGAGATDGGGH